MSPIQLGKLKDLIPGSVCHVFTPYLLSSSRIRSETISMKRRARLLSSDPSFMRLIFQAKWMH